MALRWERMARMIARPKAKRRDAACPAGGTPAATVRKQQEERCRRVAARFGRIDDQRERERGEDPVGAVADQEHRPEAAEQREDAVPLPMPQRAEGVLVDRDEGMIRV